MIYRKAKIEDVPIIQQLINNYANRGLMLAKPLIAIYENLREYVIAEDEKTSQITGVGGLHILWDDLAEVRSLAVAEPYFKQGIGRELVHRLEADAKSLGLPQVFALTYQTDFFKKLGYTEIENKLLPQKVWMECINCPKFPDCDERAVLKKLE
ncbi:MAG: N-acetyltransferase [Clostridia bacterium]|nr:N-acetyltransferase [Clostridia bacterium]MDD4571272.1 N-acetyltransferase [Clostridia bacterium]